MIAKRIKVSGRVQGVFFRVSTKDKAEELGIKGWVKNEPDGSVLIEAQGDIESLKFFEEWCHKGPLMAKVVQVELTKIEPGKFDTFQVRY